jgi:hypothetical protein
MPRAYLAVLATLVLAFGIPFPAAALPYGAHISQADGDGGLRVAVTVYVHAGALDYPDQWQLLRRTVVPGLDPVVDLGDGWLPMPPPGESWQTVWTDADIDAHALGFFEVWGSWVEGGEVLLDAEELSLAEHPYVLRGRLIGDNRVDPCTGTGLLECQNVTLANSDWWNQYGNGPLLDIYGWPVQYADLDDCTIHVTWIGPLPEDGDCDDPMATTGMPWSTVRALYR